MLNAIFWLVKEVGIAWNKKEYSYESYYIFKNCLFSFIVIKSKTGSLSILKL